MFGNPRHVRLCLRPHLRREDDAAGSAPLRRIVFRVQEKKGPSSGWKIHGNALPFETNETDA